jgi:cytoskeletal protein CcmA (bactofilin family)
MAIFDKQQAPAKPASGFSPEPVPAPAKDSAANTDFAPAQPPLQRAASSAKESLIAADLTIEGKIEGSGHVRIAGKFKGDVNVKGDLTIESGAKLTGGVRANRVNVAGELEGNIEAASRVELVESGAVNGDIKAETLTVAAGSRIRGRVECGAWGDAKSSSKSNGNGHAESEAA